MLIYLLIQGHPGCCMDLGSWGGYWDVWTRIPVRNEGPSAIGMLPKVLNSQTPSGMALTEDSCLAKGRCPSWVATYNDCSKNPAFLSHFRFFWNLSENQASVDTVSLLSVTWSCLLLSLLFPRGQALPDKLSFYILASILFVLTTHKIPFQRCPSHTPTTFFFTFRFCLKFSLLNNQARCPCIQSSSPYFQ